MKSKELIMYTDGSCNVATKEGAFSVIILGNAKSKNKKIERCCVSITCGEKETTNNQMELKAFIRALEFAKEKQEKVKSITIYSDSAYVVNGATSWIYGWKLRNWTKDGVEPIKNKELWKKVDNLLKWANSNGMKLMIKKVKAHSGNTYNELADKLAKAHLGIEVETIKKLNVKL